MKVRDIVAALDAIAPPAYAEDWDNVGLLVGRSDAPCGRAMLCIDLTPAVLAEAHRLRARLVMAYHPAIFKPLPRVTAEAAPIVYQAIRAGLAIHSVHTAYDAAVGGSNDALADALGISADRRPLEPRIGQGTYKIVAFVPPDSLPAVAQAAFAAGAGRLGHYSQCGFAAAGAGTFFGQPDTHPAVGRPGRREEVAEQRWETLCPRGRLTAVLAAIRAAHPYEEPAVEVYPLADAPAGVGLGRVGRLVRPTLWATMLRRIKRVCGVTRVQLAGRPRRVRTLAVGCGSCGRLFRDALTAGADLYVTGELRHHDALAASAAGLPVACVGHSNSERPTLPRLAARLLRAPPGLDVRLSQADRDPYSIV